MYDNDMMHAPEMARMREFIAAKGLREEFDAFTAAHDERVRLAGTPELEVKFENNYSRRSHEDEVNVTPWLRDASFEDACRFARLVQDETDTCNDEHGEDGAFLTGIVASCLDEEQTEWHWRAQSVRVMLYFVGERMREVLPDIRPQDHDRIMPLLIDPKGPVGPGKADRPEAMGTLL